MNHDLNSFVWLCSYYDGSPDTQLSHRLRHCRHLSLCDRSNPGGFKMIRSSTPTFCTERVVQLSSAVSQKGGYCDPTYLWLTLSLCPQACPSSSTKSRQRAIIFLSAQQGGAPQLSLLPVERNWGRTDTEHNVIMPLYPRANGLE